MLKSEKIKNDSILILSTISLLILSGFIIFRFNYRPELSAPQVIGAASLTVDFGNNQKRIFEGDIVGNETLVNTLAQASKAGNFSYKLDQKSNLTAVEKFIADGKKSWHWYLNGKKIDKPLNEIIVKSSDNILIKYE